MDIPGRVRGESGSLQAAMNQSAAAQKWKTLLHTSSNASFPKPDAHAEPWENLTKIVYLAAVQFNGK